MFITRLLRSSPSEWRHLLQTASGSHLIRSSYESSLLRDPSASNELVRDAEMFEIYLKALANVGVGEGGRKRAVDDRRHVLQALRGVDQQRQAFTEPLQLSFSQSQSQPQPLPQPLQHSFAQSQSQQHPNTNPNPNQSPLLVQLHKTASERRTESLKTLLNLSLSLAFAYFVYSRILSAGGMMSSPTSIYKPSESDDKFSDIHGVDEAKEELQELVDFLRDPTLYSNLGGKIAKGVLLTGPPGTGKTMLARAVAKEAGVPFFYASGSEFEEMFVGIGASRIRQLFQLAKESRPAIVFVDELDAIGGSRNSKDMNQTKQSLNQLLTELDGFNQSDGIIVIGSTNLPDSLDKALVRPGRFDKIVNVPLPDVRGRMAIITNYLAKITAHAEVDPQTIARGTSGFSGAELQNLVNQAAVRASKLKALSVTQAHFDWARDKLLMGNLRTSAFITPESKARTAYHEAGHALVNLYTPGAMPLHKVSCMPRGHALGVTSMLPEMDRDSETFEQALAHIDVSMGGRAAEELIYGKMQVTSGASSDITNATRVASAMVRNWGFSDLIGPVAYPQDSNISAEKRAEIDSETKNLILQGSDRAKEVLRSHKKELIKLANALVEYEELTADEVRQVIQGNRIRR